MIRQVREVQVGILESASDGNRLQQPERGRGMPRRKMSRSRRSLLSTEEDATSEVKIEELHTVNRMRNYDTTKGMVTIMRRNAMK